MNKDPKSRRGPLSAPLSRREVLAAGIACAFWGGVIALGDSTLAAAPEGQATSAYDPWTVAQTVSAADLVNEMRDPQVAAKLVIVCVAPHGSFMAGHIPGAVYHGPASTPDGMDDLKIWARDHLLRTTNLVVYCGCCPMNECPNLRPAFAALKNMGFTHLRALLLPTDFYTDWAGKGYPSEPKK
jgi:thiosulfate/3-mercaptopyruvate sulfurtransferase